MKLLLNNILKSSHLQRPVATAHTPFPPHIKTLLKILACLNREKLKRQPNIVDNVT